MKQLADGTFVSDDTPTKNISGLRYLLSMDDIVEQNQREAAWIVEKAKRDKLEKRQKALAAKWPDPFDLLDDILERGLDTVKAERNAIKTENPKE